MTDFWYSLATSAYESANAWRTQAIAASLPVSDLMPLEAYSNYQKAIADYKAAESAYINALIDNGGIGGGGGGDVPSTRLISAGTGLEGGGDLSADRTLSLANTAVTPATYGSTTQTPSVTIDAQGRITSASNNTITPANIGAVSTTRSITTGTGLSGGGNLSADRTLSLANTAVTPASYGSTTQTPTIVVDAQGRITSASNNTLTPANIGAVPTNRNVATGTGLTGGGALTTDVTISLANTAVTPATYGSTTQAPSITVNAQGQITAASNNTITPANIGAVPTTRNISIGTGLTGGGDLSADRTISLANTAVTAASYGSTTQTPSITVNAQGQITAASNTTISLTETSQTFSFASNWTEHSTTYQARYRRLDKLVVFSGLVKRSATSGTSIATLPIGYRPITHFSMAVQGYLNPSYTTFVLDIDVNGLIFVQTPLPGTNIDWISISGINFFAG